MLKILEHSSSSYSPRTYHNAHVSDVTVAIAEDPNTSGEKCTHKAAGGKLVCICPRFPLIGNARVLYSKLKSCNGRILNIAGNGIATLSKYGWDQGEIDEYVYTLIAQIHKHWPLEQIVCGGQTGVDHAGAVAGCVLGIKTTVMLPKGYKRRYEDGKDVNTSEDTVRHSILAGMQIIQMRENNVYKK